MFNRPNVNALVLTAALVALAAPALAGPPLICHPFETGSAALLPWSKSTGNWNAPDLSYDVRRLTADTLRLLAADAPLLARMENLRRATIYAARDTAVARQLLAAVLGRALTSAAGAGEPSTNVARAYFDAAYLIEAYRQGSYIQGQERGTWTLEQPPAGLDGYLLMKKAIALAGPSAEMEFAASLMTQGAASSAHRARAVATTAPDSLLARNISRY
jgi:hypothetical protein